MTHLQVFILYQYSNSLRLSCWRNYIQVSTLFTMKEVDCSASFKFFSFIFDVHLINTVGFLIFNKVKWFVNQSDIWHFDIVLK